jgi:two-component system, NtrC family, response regulator AtoC
MGGPERMYSDDEPPPSETTARSFAEDRTPSARSVRVILGDEVSAHALPSSGELAVGRGAEILVRHTNVSRRHLAFRMGRCVEVADLGSTNATTLFGARLDPHRWVRVQAGDILVLGGEALVQLHDGDERSLPKRRMGRESLDRQLDEKLAEHGRTGTSFGVCMVKCRSARRWLDVLAGVLLEKDQLVVLSDTEAALLLAERTYERAEGVAKAVEEHLVRLGAGGVVRHRHCPEHGTTADALVDRPAEGRGQKTTPRPAGPLCRNAAMRKLYELVDEIAPSHVNLLILGETGVGKDVLAHAVHERSGRASAPFVGLNCSAMPELLLESELFGYERGAFTGAVTAKPGLLETAEGGTVFLDELGEMPLATQAKLLRVLEERTVRRVGGLKPKAIDVRVIAATNRNLAHEIAEGRFRADLFYRLNGISLLVPPLRERVDEIEAFARHFMTNAAGILNRPPPTLSPDALACLEAHSWPGNIRELRNVIERAVLLARDGVITPELLPTEVTGAEPPRNDASRPSPPPARPPMPTLTGDEATFAGTDSVTGDYPALTEAPLAGALEQLERARIVDALAKCNGNQTRAAQLLGVTRRVLIKRIERYNLPRPRGPQSD